MREGFRLREAVVQAEEMAGLKPQGRKVLCSLEEDWGTPGVSGAFKEMARCDNG